MEFINTLLSTIDITVNQYAFDSYKALAEEMKTTLRLMFMLSLIFLGINSQMGWIPTTLQEIIKNFFRFLFIFVFATNWEIFSTTIYPILTNAPSQIGNVIMGAGNGGGDINTALGGIFDRIIIVANQMIFKSDLSAFGTKILGFLLGGVGFVVVIYAVFLIVLAKIALAILLGLAPLFLSFMMFATTRGLFEGWLRQLMNFALIPILTYSVLIFVVALVEPLAGGLYVASTKAGAQTTDMYQFILSAAVSIILLKQVMGIAAGISGGMQLSTMGAVAGAAKKGLSGAKSGISGGVKLGGALKGLIPGGNSISK